jgi:hypothetical protein
MFYMKVDNEFLEMEKKRTKAEVLWLINLRKTVGDLNVKIHDKIVYLAKIELLKMHKDLKFDINRTGIAGKILTDIAGFREKRLVLACEVKATGRDITPNRIRKAIKEDMDKLASIDCKYKYFVVISDSAHKIALKYKDGKKYNNIVIIRLPLILENKT